MSSSPIDAYLERLHERWQGDGSGAVADHIPPLALADPGWFGIAVATTDGHCYEVGDSRLPFTIQSISKPFTSSRPAPGLNGAQAATTALALSCGGLARVCSTTQ